MTQENNYPDLTYEMVFKIYTIGQNLKKSPNYLDEAPYSETVKKSLQLIFAAKNYPTNPTGTLDTSNLDIKQETEYLYRETKELLRSSILDEKDKAAVIKTATSQMEKLINLIERADNIAQIRDFEARVLRALKKVLPETREDFIKELTKMENEDEPRG